MGYIETDILGAHSFLYSSLSLLKIGEVYEALFIQGLAKGKVMAVLVHC